MSFLSENVIPGEHGKVFGTNAKGENDLRKVQEAIMKIKGVKDCLFDLKIFPRELTVHTSDVVSVKEVEDAVNAIGFHLVPKQMFRL